MKRIPLGRHETSTLEFTQKDSLSHPESIGREIVGMLNSGGGEVWIGIKEQDGTAVSIEYPVARFRLASWIYRNQRVADSGKVLADAALIGIEGWVLRPYSPRSLHFQYPMEAPNAWTEGRDLIWDRALIFRGNEIIEEPDWCAFRLVRRFYEAFGYSEDKIPLEFDRGQRRLTIPD